MDRTGQGRLERGRGIFCRLIGRGGKGGQCKKKAAANLPRPSFCLVRLSPSSDQPTENPSSALQPSLSCPPFIRPSNQYSTSTKLIHDHFPIHPTTTLQPRANHARQICRASKSFASEVKSDSGESAANAVEGAPEIRGLVVGVVQDDG